jgi:hypothetical protein
LQQIWKKWGNRGVGLPQQWHVARSLDPVSTHHCRSFDVN